MVKIGLVVASLHMGEVVGYPHFFPVTWLSGTRTGDAGRSIPTYWISIDAVLLKNVLFGISRGGVIPKPPFRGREEGCPV